MGPLGGLLAAVPRASLSAYQARQRVELGKNHRTRLHPRPGRPRSPVAVVSRHVLAGQALLGAKQRHAWAGRRKEVQQKVILPIPTRVRETLRPQRPVAVLHLPNGKEHCGRARKTWPLCTPHAAEAPEGRRDFAIYTSFPWRREPVCIWGCSRSIAPFNTCPLVCTRRVSPRRRSFLMYYLRGLVAFIVADSLG